MHPICPGGLLRHLAWCARAVGRGRRHRRTRTGDILGVLTQRARLGRLRLRLVRLRGRGEVEVMDDRSILRTDPNPNPNP